MQSLGLTSNPFIVRDLRSARPGKIAISLVLCGLSLAVGCASHPTSGTSPGTTPQPDPSHLYITGNWGFRAVPTKGSAPFSGFSGFINEQGTNPGVNDLTTAVFQAQSPTCYTTSPVIPLQGAVVVTQLGLSSFAVDGQVLTLSASEDATAMHLTGTYSMAGGCADGATGTISGGKYSTLNGLFAGAISGTTPSQTLSLNLSQFAQGTGDGSFLVTGSATFGGFTCFSSGSLASGDGSLLGNSLNFSFVTNDPSKARMTLSGQMDIAAKTITLTSGSITSGSCSGNLNVAGLILSKQ